VQRLLGVWDTRSGNLKWSLPNPEVLCLAADGGALAGLVSEIFWRKWGDSSGSSTYRARGKQSVTVWDAVNGQIKWQTDPGEGLSLNEVRFDPARPRLLGFCWRKLARWDLSSGKPLDQRNSAMSVSGSASNLLRLSSDGRTAGVLHIQKNVEVWNIENMKQLGGLSFPESLLDPAFSPDLKLLVGKPFGGASVILHLNWTGAGTKR
jgi:hypothetical protein